MTLPERKLAEALDEWVITGRAIVTEHTRELVILRLSATDALQLVGSLEALGWDHSIEDGTHSPVTKDEVKADYEPFKIIAEKREVTEGRDHVLTLSGFKDWLGRPSTHSTLEVARLGSGFQTLSVNFVTPEQGGNFVPEILSSDPRSVVKESGESRIVPSDVSPWLLGPHSDVDLADGAAKAWAEIAAFKLATSLANEIEGQHTLVLKGPPMTRFEATNHMVTDLEKGGFSALQACANWVFSAPKEMETRHILMTAELSRIAPGSDDLPSLYRNSGEAALEGAKIAFEMGLHKISADTLKALADLRKAVSDEAAKLGDTTRQLATAVSGAMFGGIALIVARLTMVQSNLTVSVAVLLIGVVLAVYVAGTIWTGNQFVKIQRDLREQWRNRLYRFLPDNEYQRMVTDPAQRAESAFWFASWISGILAFVLLAAVISITGPELWQRNVGSTETNSTAAQKPAEKPPQAPLQQKVIRDEKPAPADQPRPPESSVPPQPAAPRQDEIAPPPADDEKQTSKPAPPASERIGSEK